MSVAKPLWRIINSKLIITFILAIIFATIASTEWNAKSAEVNPKLIAIIGIAGFIFFASTALNTFTEIIRKFTYPYLGVGRATTIQFILRTIGYPIILLETLSLINVPIQTLLLGSAVTGIILGVAAQQALANFFASIILLISQPFKVGQRTYIKGGAFGEYTGTIIDMGLTHTKLELDDGTKVLLPNATLLSSAAIMSIKPKEESKKKS
ncbi:MAG TPA: mechanosensitive ion channel domain-containing protein [Candidatus Saccharimonadales bacterium]|nr:mechanosensitive ion channel domain-containing protein [Candidatus Saccharimonadales bacterium]